MSAFMKKTTIAAVAAVCISQYGENQVNALMLSKKTGGDPLAEIDPNSQKDPAKVFKTATAAHEPSAETVEANAALQDIMEQVVEVDAATAIQGRWKARTAARASNAAASTLQRRWRAHRAVAAKRENLAAKMQARVRGKQVRDATKDHLPKKRLFAAITAVKQQFSEEEYNAMRDLLKPDNLSELLDFLNKEQLNNLADKVKYLSELSESGVAAQESVKAEITLVFFTASQRKETEMFVEEQLQYTERREKAFENLKKFNFSELENKSRVLVAKIIEAREDLGATDNLDVTLIPKALRQKAEDSNAKARQAAEEKLRLFNDQLEENDQAYTFNEHKEERMFNLDMEKLSRATNTKELNNQQELNSMLKQVESAKLEEFRAGEAEKVQGYADLYALVNDRKDQIHDNSLTIKELNQELSKYSASLEHDQAEVARKQELVIAGSMGFDAEMNLKFEISFEQGDIAYFEAEIKDCQMRIAFYENENEMENAFISSLIENNAQMVQEEMTTMESAIHANYDDIRRNTGTKIECIDELFSGNFSKILSENVSRASIKHIEYLESLHSTIGELQSEGDSCLDCVAYICRAALLIRENIANFKYNARASQLSKKRANINKYQQLANKPMNAVISEIPDAAATMQAKIEGDYDPMPAIEKEKERIAEEAARSALATKVQALVRGNQVRANNKERKAFSTKIQARVRGNQVRAEQQLVSAKEAEKLAAEEKIVKELETKLAEEEEKRVAEEAEKAAQKKEMEDMKTMLANQNGILTQLKAKLFAKEKEAPVIVTVAAPASLCGSAQKEETVTTAEENSPDNSEESTPESCWCN